jgi:glycosyltransferase involved in cell wall biosynthesis
MKIGYFSHTNLTVSETFIYDLVKDLNVDKDIELIYYSGRSSGRVNVDFDLKSVQTGFSEDGEKRAFLVYKLGRFMGAVKAAELRMATHKKRALHSLIKTVREPIDVAFIEYANSAILLREFMNLKKIPFIVHVHGYDITSSLNIPGYIEELKKVIEEASYFVTASEYMKRLLILQGANANKIKVIRIGIDVESIQPLSWEERLKRKPSVIFLGRLTEKKHPIALLHAFQLVLLKMPEAKLTIIGDGPLKAEVEDRIKRLNIVGSVELKGSLSRGESFPILNSQWVYAQHSVTSGSGDQEGYALSPAEAAAHGLPVVSTIHNGIPEHVIDGVTGYLVPEFNFEAMADKIIFLLQNPLLAEQMGGKGRMNIRQLNSQAKRVESIKSLFHLLAGRE